MTHNIPFNTRATTPSSDCGFKKMIMNFACHVCQVCKGGQITSSLAGIVQAAEEKPHWYGRSNRWSYMSLRSGGCLVPGNWRASDSSKVCRETDEVGFTNGCFCFPASSGGVSKLPKTPQINDPPNQGSWHVIDTKRGIETTNSTKPRHKTHTHFSLNTQAVLHKALEGTEAFL